MNLFKNLYNPISSTHLSLTHSIVKSKLGIELDLFVEQTNITSIFPNPSQAVLKQLATFTILLKLLNDIFFLSSFFLFFGYRDSFVEKLNFRQLFPDMEFRGGLLIHLGGIQ